MALEQILTQSDYIGYYNLFKKSMLSTTFLTNEKNYTMRMVSLHSLFAFYLPLLEFSC